MLKILILHCIVAVFFVDLFIIVMLVRSLIVFLLLLKIYYKKGIYVSYKSQVLQKRTCFYLRVEYYLFHLLNFGKTT